jgi:hypothetical protein
VWGASGEYSNFDKPKVALFMFVSITHKNDDPLVHNAICADYQHVNTFRILLRYYMGCLNKEAGCDAKNTQTFMLTITRKLH